MYKIIDAEGNTIAVTETPAYIKVGSSGSYCHTDEAHAEGIAAGIPADPYSLIGKDPLPGAVGEADVVEFDGAQMIQEQAAVIAEQNQVIDDILVMLASADSDEAVEVSDATCERYQALYTEGKVTDDGLSAATAAGILTAEQVTQIVTPAAEAVMSDADI